MNRAAMLLLFIAAAPVAVRAAEIADPEVKMLKANSDLGTLLIDFEIKNPNPFAIKDVRILCSAYAKSGTDLRLYKPTVYDTVPANGFLIAKKIAVGPWPAQALDVRCLGWTATRQ